MIKITTWQDTFNIPETLKKFVQKRFKYLYKVYSDNKSLPFQEFSLDEHGEILLVECFSEIGLRRKSESGYLWYHMHRKGE